MRLRSTLPGKRAAAGLSSLRQNLFSSTTPAKRRRSLIAAGAALVFVSGLGVFTGSGVTRPDAADPIHREVPGAAQADGMPVPGNVAPPRYAPTPQQGNTVSAAGKALSDKRAGGKSAQTATTAVYQLADGRRQAEIATQPVHYRDAKGVWRDIDLRIKAEAADGYAYAVASNTFVTRFGTDAEHLISYDLGGRGVALGLQEGGAAELKPTVAGSRITYPDVFGEGDLVYEVTSTSVRKKIVLDKAPDNATYTFTMTLRDVDAQAQPDGTIAFRAAGGDGRVLFYLPRPYMYDSAKDNKAAYGTGFSDKVTQTLHRDGDRLTVTLAADKQWLASKDRKYPVVIDPTVRIQPTQSESEDAMIWSTDPAANFDGNWQLSVGTGTSTVARSLVKFDLSTVPSGTAIDSAQLQLYYDQTFVTSSNNVPLEARRVTSPWSEKTVTWNSINTAFAEAGGNTEQVDNGDSAKVAVSGAWAGTANTNAVNGSYLRSDSTANGSVTWVPRITESGTYNVEVHYIPAAGHATAAPVTVRHSAGNAPITVDQTQGTGHVWKSIGSWNFNAGTTHSISIGGQAGKVVVADAIRLTKAGVTKAASVSNVWHTYSVRSTVQSWLNGTANHGFMLKATSEALNQGGPIYEAAEYAYEGETINTPKLVVTYGKPGVLLTHPTTIRATGADLSWSTYADSADLVEYQVHRSVYPNFTPTNATLVAPVPPGQTTYNDSSATPTPAASPELGTAYTYLIAVRTKSNELIASPAVQVRLPKAGQVRQVFRDAIDTSLTSGQPTTGHDVLGVDAWIGVGNSSTTYGITRSVVKFPSLAPIPYGAKVIDADLDLWAHLMYGNATATYAAHGLTKSFTEATGTWTSTGTGVNWATPGGDFNATVLGTAGGVTNDPGWVEFDIDSQVQQWIDTPTTNHGLLVKLANETTPLERAYFTSAEAVEPILRPTLEVLYTEPNATYYAPTTPDRMIPGDQYTVPVTITNTTATTWNAADWVLSYHWFDIDGNEVTNSGNRRDTPLAASLAPKATATLNAAVMTPVRSDSGNKREAFVLKWDLFNKVTGLWLSQNPGVPPLAQNITVEDPTSDQLGLEKFYSYYGTNAGGMSVSVNQFSGNAVVGYDALNNPGRGLATSLRITYNSADTSKSPLGYGWTLMASTITRLGTPLQLRGNNQWPQQVDYVDGDGTTHVFELNKHGSTDESLWDYDNPAGVHLYLQRTNSGDPIREWMMTRPDRSQIFFDEQGYQSAMRDRNGNELLFTYERKQVNNRNSGVLRYVTDASTRQTLTLDYYARGDSYVYYANDVRTNGTNLTSGQIVDQLKSITAVANKDGSAGRKLLFIYSDKGQLQEIDDGAGTAAEKRFVFYYDPAIGQPKAKLIRIKDPRGNSTSISYYDTNSGQLLRLRARTITDRNTKPINYTYVDPDGTTGSQIRTTVTDANSRSTISLLDGFGRVTELTNAKNELTKLTWDDDNNVRRLEEPNTAVTTWTFDPKTGYPMEIKDAEANRNGTPPMIMVYQTGLGGHIADLANKTSPEGRRWTFVYDIKGNLTSVTDPKGTATPTTGDFTTVYGYDGFGQLTTETDANERTTIYGAYDVMGYPTTIRDPKTFTTTYTYDSRGNVLSIVNPLNKRADYTYDVFDRPLTSKIPKSGTTFITTAAPVYDGNDNVTQSTAPTGAVSTAVYDPMDRMTSQVLPKDTATSPTKTYAFVYDNVGNVTRMTEPKGVLTTTDPNDFVTTYTYDALDRMTDAVDALGGRASVVYDNVGNVVKELDQNANATPDLNDFSASYTYDFNHRMKTATDGDGFVTKADYDKDGAVLGVTDQENNKTIYNYDQRAALIEQKVPHSMSGTVINYHTTQYEYDEVGNQTRVISPRGIETTGDLSDFAQTTVYDELNRVKEKWLPYDVDDVRYTTPQKTIYNYDAAGNLTTIDTPPSEGQTQRAITTQTYFDNGWLRTETDPWGIETTFDYDNLGSQTSRIMKGVGGTPTRTMTWTYVPDGKVATRTDEGDATGVRKSFEFSYDPNSNLTQMLDRSSNAKIDTYVLGYDGVNRLSRVEEKLGSALKNTSTFTYEANDNVKTRTHDKQHSAFTYNKRNLATIVKNGKTPTDASPKTTTYSYTPRGQIDIETRANGNTVDNDYYLDGLMKRIIERKANGTVVNDRTLTYNANGHRLTDVMHKQNADNKTSYLDTTSTFAYDPLDRVRSVTKTGAGAGTETYVHDANHNVISQTVKGVSTSFTYDRNRLVSSVTNGVTASYVYDPYGRLQRVTAAGVDIERYVYDGFDRVSSHTTVSGGTTTFVYDPLDRQIQRTRAGKTTDFTYLGLSPKLLTEEEGGVTKKIYHYQPGGRLLSQIKLNTDGSEEPSFYNFDSHSSVDGITDQQGDQRATYGYTAYGRNDDAQFTGVDKPDPANPQDPNKEAYNSFRYDSKRFDQASGDYDMGFRDYDPGLNRFLTRDSYNGALSDLNLSTDPYTQNRYAFANGNPISNVELDGHNALSDVFSELGEAVKETGEGLLNLYATLDDASATSVGTDPARQKEAQQQVYNTIDTLTDRGKLEDALSAEYNEDAGNPTRQHTRQAFDLATVFIGGSGGASKAGMAGKASRAGGAAQRAGSSAGVLERLKGCLTNSFTPETRVLMADGSAKPIGEVDLGDKVLATNAETGKTTGEPVAARITGNGVKQLVDITIASSSKVSSTVTATEGHPFWVVDEQRWVEAGELEEGDLLRTAEGATVRVIGVALRAQTQRVHNLNVETVHTYYVLAGDRPVLVHNCGYQPEAQAAQVRAQFLESQRGWSGGTTSVIGVRDVATGKITNKIAINGKGNAPKQWSLNPNTEQFVKGPGHAEETIFNSLKPGEEVLYGGTSRNVCQNICAKFMRPWSLRLDGQVFRGMQDKTAYRTFWRTWRY